MRTHIPEGASLIPKEAHRVFSGIIYDVYNWEQKMFDDSVQTFEMLKRPDTVKIIPVKEGKVVITKQTQPNLKEFKDIPGGMHDIDDEDELQAAQRELREETGLVCKYWKLVSINQPHNKIEQFVYIFIAWDVLEENEQMLDNGEKIETELIAFSDFKTSLGTSGFRSPPMKWLDRVNSIEELLNLPEFS